MYAYLFDPLPYPEIELNLDGDITVRQILAYPGTKEIFDSTKPNTLPFTPPEPYVHVHIKGNAILLNGRVVQSVISTIPLVTSTPDKVLSKRFAHFGKGGLEHPRESHERSRQFYDKYIDVGVDTDFVDFVFQRTIAAAGWDNEPGPKLARVWLTIAAAEVQRMYPTGAWFAPHITDWFLESAARREFSSGNWGTIVSHAHDEYIAHTNGLWQYEDSFPVWDNTDLYALSMPLV